VTPLQPGLCLMLGLPGVGKSGLVMRWLADARAEAPLLVVPNRPDVQAYGLELATSAGPLFGPFPVCTFEELAARVAGERTRGLGPLGRSLLARRLVRGQGLGAISRVADFPGTVGALSAVLDQLEESAQSPEEVRAHLACWGDAYPEDAPLTLDLATLLARRREMLACLDVSGRADVWRAAAASVDRFGLPVAIHGFAGFEPRERRLLLALSRVVPVLVSLPYEEGRAATAALRREVGVLRAAARRVTVVPHSAASDGPVWRRRLIEGLMTGACGSPSSATDEQSSGLTTAVASGRRAEAELAAEEVARLLRAGAAPDDVVVLVGRVGAWRRLLAQVLGGAGIPFSIDAELPLGETGLGHALLEGVGSLMGGEAPGLFSYLHSPYSGVPLEVGDRLESAFHRAFGRKWERLVAATREEAPGVIEELEVVLRGGPRGVPAVDPEMLSGLARRMLVRAAKGHSLHSFEIKEDAKAVSALCGAAQELEQLEGLLPGACSAWGETPSASEALGALAALPVHLGEDGERGTVRVMSAHRSRTRPVRAVLLLGLVEGEFPEAGDGSLLVSAQQRARAAEACGVELLPTQEPNRDALVFLLVVSRAAESLYVSSRDTEEDGGPVSVSPYWEGVQSLFPNARRLRRGLDEVVADPESAACHREYLRACVAGGLRPPAPMDSRRLEALAPWSRGPAGLSSRVTARGEFERSHFSASEIEDYSRCPFSWFIRHALRIEEMAPEFGASGQGTVSHRVLSAVYAALGQDGLLPLRQEHIPRALELADLHLAVELHAVSGQGSEDDRAASLWLVKDQVRRLLEFDAAARSSFVPAGFELDLGAGGEADLGGFSVTGRIDRLDVDTVDGVALVVDYKSGAVPRSPALAQSGRLQLPLYLLALRAARPDTELAGAVFYSLRSGDVRGLLLRAFAERVGNWAPKSGCVDADRFEQELVDCRALAEEAVSGLRTGAINARPRDGECPRWCGLVPVCRRPERKAGS
jgi:ATP-dependent helicase/nuclease subunit B